MMRSEDWEKHRERGRNSLRFNTYCQYAKNTETKISPASTWNLEFRRKENKNISNSEDLWRGSGGGKIENVKLAGKQAIRENNINRPRDEGNVVGSKNNNNDNSQ